MLACTMTKYEYIIPAKNKWIYLKSSISLASMKLRYEDYQKTIQNLFKYVYCVVKRKITILLKLDVFEIFVK